MTVIKIFALKNFKINIHQNVSRAFNILHYNIGNEQNKGILSTGKMNS